MSIVRALYSRFQVLIHELMKFGVVGAFNAALDIAIFNWLRLRGMEPLTSKAIAVAIAATSSYFMNRHWSFRHRARTGLKREYPLFFLFNGIGLLIALGCLAMVHHVFGADDPLTINIFGNGLGLVLGTLFRFLAYKRWVFVAHPEHALPHAVAGGTVTEVPFAEETDDEVAADLVAETPRR